MSLVATATQTGYFSASFRIVEVIIAVPSLIAGAAFPILARAAETDRVRLAYALQRLFEAGVILGGWTAISVVLGAQVGIDVLGGEDYQPAVPSADPGDRARRELPRRGLGGGAVGHRRQARAAAGERRRGVGRDRAHRGRWRRCEGAIGAAIAMTIAEVVLVVALGTSLMRAQPDLRVSWTVAFKALPATAAALAVWFVPVHDVAKVALASLVYFGVLDGAAGDPARPPGRRSRTPSRDRAGGGRGRMRLRYSRP